MQLMIKIPKDDTLSSVCGHVGKTLRAFTRKQRRERYANMKDHLRPWPVVKLVKMEKDHIVYDVDWREGD